MDSVGVGPVDANLEGFLDGGQRAAQRQSRGKICKERMRTRDKNQRSNHFQLCPIGFI